MAYKSKKPVQMLDKGNPSIIKEKDCRRNEIKPQSPFIDIQIVVKIKAGISDLTAKEKIYQTTERKQRPVSENKPGTSSPVFLVFEARLYILLPIILTACVAMKTRIPQTVFFAPNQLKY